MALSADLPRSLRGRNKALAIGSLNDFQVRDQQGAATFESMYGASPDQVLNGTGARNV